MAKATVKAAAKPAAKKPAAKPAAKGGAMAGLAAVLGSTDLASLTDGSGQDYSNISIADIAVKTQVRTIFEDAENSLEDLASSIREYGVLQPIVVRPTTGALPFELVAGERRVRASKIAGKEKIPAIVRELSDADAQAVQFAENIQRKNLTQIETAERLQRDLDNLDGDIEALMAKHQKSRAWISKWLSILDLPEQTRRLVSENVSADLEVISDVKQVEKVDPAAAGKLVDELKAAQGQPGKTAREISRDAKDAAKPPKKPRQQKPKPGNPDNVATPPDRSQELAGEVKTGSATDVAPATVEQAMQAMQDAQEGEQQATPNSAPGDAEDQGDFFAHAKNPAEGDDQEQGENANQEPAGDQAGQGTPPALPPAEALDKAYSLAFHSGSAPKMILETMPEKEREDCTNWLRAFYAVGEKSKDIGSAVIKGFRGGEFATEGHAALALSAFLYGTDSNAKFSMLDIIGSVKKS